MENNKGKEINTLSSEKPLKGKVEPRRDAQGRFTKPPDTLEYFYAKAVSNAPYWKRVAGNNLDANALQLAIYTQLAKDVKAETAKLFNMKEEEIHQLMEDAGAALNIIGKETFDPRNSNLAQQMDEALEVAKNIDIYRGSTYDEKAKNALEYLKTLCQKFVDGYEGLESYAKDYDSLKKVIEEAEALVNNKNAQQQKLTGYWSYINGLIAEPMIIQKLKEIEQEVVNMEQNIGVPLVFEDLRGGNIPKGSPARLARTPRPSDQSKRDQRKTFFKFSNIRATGKGSKSNPKGDVTLVIEYFNEFGTQIGASAEVSFSVKNYSGEKVSRFDAASSLSLNNLIVKRKSLISFLLRLVDIENENDKTFSMANKKRILGAVFADFIIGGRADASVDEYRALIGFGRKVTGPPENRKSDVSVFFLSDYFARLGLGKTTKKGKIEARPITVSNVEGPTAYKSREAKKGFEDMFDTDLSRKFFELKATTLKGISAPFIKFY